MKQVLCPWAFSESIQPDWLDGAMIVLAMYTLNIFHPGRLLGHLIGKNASSDLGSSEENIKKMSNTQITIQSAV